MSRVPVTVLTGFLGAGKTTLLRSLLTQADGRRIAVIVNEFGDAGFDGGLVEECAAQACSAGDIVELTNGCICCTVADDFIPTMDRLLSRERPLDAIVIVLFFLAVVPGARRDIVLGGGVQSDQHGWRQIALRAHDADTGPQHSLQPRLDR